LPYLIDMSKISIITINLNNAKGLQRTIESVLSQSYTDYEFVIIDGASTDGSVDIIKKKGSKNFYWQSEPDDGIYDAMNKGIRHAKSDYCLFLNSGDILYSPDILEKVIQIGLHDDIVYGNCVLQQKKGSNIQRFPKDLTFYWLFTEYLCHPSTFIKRELFNKTGYYNVDRKIVADWEFFLLAIGKHNVSVRFVDIIVSVVEAGGISSSATYKQIVQEERRQVMQEHFPYFYVDYQALYTYRHNPFLKKVKRVIKKLILWKRTG